MTDGETRRSVAILFLELAASGRLDEAYSHVSTSFSHHNPYFKGDAESLKAGMAQAHENFPSTTFAVQHVLERMATWSRSILGSDTRQTRLKWR